MYPAPKSSSASPTPAAARSTSRARASGASSKRVRSLSSSVSRLGFETGLGKGVGDVLGQVAGCESGRRHVDRDGERGCPLSGLPACLVQHPTVDGFDQPGVFGEREEAGRTEQAASGVVPSDQGLVPDDLSGWTARGRAGTPAAAVRRAARVATRLRVAGVGRPAHRGRARTSPPGRRRGPCAEYMAASALRIRRRTSVPSCGNNATPMLASTVSSCPLISCGAVSAFSSLSATRRGCPEGRRSLATGQRTRLRRAGRACPRRAGSAQAVADRCEDPVADLVPEAVVDDLEASRSRNKMASGVRCRVAVVNAWSSRS